MGRKQLAGVLFAVVLTVAFVIVMVLGIRAVSDRTASNCQGIHQLVKTLDTILASGDKQIAQYVREGTLTPEQGARADRERAKQRAVLAGADCPPARRP